MFGLFRLKSASPCLGEQHLRPDTDVLLFIQEQADLISQIEIGFVVGSGRDKDDLCIIPLNIFADCLS